MATPAPPRRLEASSGLSRTADARGFIVVYPGGVQNAWDMTQGGRDAGFLRELVARLSARGNIDRRRVFVTGFSMGGGMANRAACDLADVFAAAAPVSGSYQWHQLCVPRRPMPIFSVHGAADTTVPLGRPERLLDRGHLARRVGAGATAATCRRS